VRGKAVAVSTSANWIFNFALSYFVPPAFVSIKWKVYLLFGVFCTAMALHVFFLFPETAGKTLEEIDDIFESRTPAWKTHVTRRRSDETKEGSADAEKAGPASEGSGSLDRRS
jgi:hypothetical protein